MIPPGPIHARLACAPIRRAIAAGLLALLGLFLLYVAALRTPPEAWALAILAVAGAGALWLARALWRATAGEILLTDEGLFDGTGRLLCPLSEIVRVEAGLLAFKPANGFLLHLRRRAPMGWAPGLWWRQGRRFGVGGSVSRNEAKAMAEIITLLLARREQGTEPPA
ncbi:MAG TPA: hypothetical protein VFR34_04225 [Paracoccaceae bacterium]|nr:hypothetical protein [Paracoccaceae bacterium]